MIRYTTQQSLPIEITKPYYKGLRGSPSKRRVFAYGVRKARFKDLGKLG